MHIGNRIRKERHAAGMSLRDVAAATGGRLTAGGLSLIENGRTPTVPSLTALASALHVQFTITPRGVRMEKTQ